MSADGSAPFLPYGRQSIDDSDIRAVAAALEAEQLTTGPGVPAFEAQFAAAVGAPHAVVSNSGTAALHLPLLALGLQPGDLALVAAVSFIATANAARFCGADVVFADVDPATGLVTPDTLRDAVGQAGRSPRVVLPVHLNGWIADPAAVAELARGWGAFVIEDACHAVGGRYGECRVGACAHADATAFSLHPVKTITMGEGGVTTTRDGALAEGMRRHRNHGMTRDPARFRNAEQAFDADGAPNPWYYEMQELGFNYRATDVACALGASQLRRLDGFVARRRQLQARYDAALADLAPHVRPVAAVPGQQPALHLYAVRIAFAELGTTRAAVMRALHGRGVGTQVHYIPIYRHPYYEDLYGRRRLPGAEAYYGAILSLPFFPTMRDGDVDRVVGALRTVLGI